MSYMDYHVLGTAGALGDSAVWKTGQQSPVVLSSEQRTRHPLAPVSVSEGQRDGGLQCSQPVPGSWSRARELVGIRKQLQTKVCG